MGSTARLVAPQRTLEDPLAHLPCSTIVEYKKGQTIYSHDQPSTNLYLVIEGKVKVSRMGPNDAAVYVIDTRTGPGTRPDCRRHRPAWDVRVAPAGPVLARDTGVMR